MLKRLLIGVSMSLLILLPGNITFASNVQPVNVSVTVPTFLEIGTIPESLIIITNPMLQKDYANTVMFPVYTNVNATLSTPLTGVLTRLGGTETLPAKYFVQPETIMPPGNMLTLKTTVVPIDGLLTVAGTYKGEATITLTPTP